MGVGALCSDSYAKKMVIISIIWIKKFNDQSFKLWKLKVGNIILKKYQWAIVDISTNHNTMSKQNLCGTISDIKYYNTWKHDSEGLPNAVANLAQKSQGTWNCMGPKIDSSMC